MVFPILLCLEISASAPPKKRCYESCYTTRLTQKLDFFSPFLTMDGRCQYNRLSQHLQFVAAPTPHRITQRHQIEEYQLISHPTQIIPITTQTNQIH